MDIIGIATLVRTIKILLAKTAHRSQTIVLTGGDMMLCGWTVFLFNASTRGKSRLPGRRPLRIPERLIHKIQWIVEERVTLGTIR